MENCEKSSGVQSTTEVTNTKCDIESVHTKPFSQQIESMVSYPCTDKRPQVAGWNTLTKKVPHAQGKQFGLLCGKTNNLIVIDCDLLKNSDPNRYVDGLYAWSEWEKKYGEVCAPRVKTGSGGRHIYFLYDKEIKHKNQQLDGALVDESLAGRKIKIDILTNGRN
ncbi:hypothetical protein B4U79_17064, partial [Dinothrombium tinctorium]